MFVKLLTKYIISSFKRTILNLEFFDFNFKNITKIIVIIYLYNFYNVFYVANFSSIFVINNSKFVFNNVDVEHNAFNVFLLEPDFLSYIK